MSSIRARGLFCVAIVALVAAPAFAAELGDWAPYMSIEIVKGPDVVIDPGDDIYVVEFWATWCGPCLKTIPRLTEIHKKWKPHGLKMIGITTEEPSVVYPFVKKMGNKMGYTVAIDTGETDKLYRGAFNVTTIPHAFVVNHEARITWHGNPGSGELEQAIRAAVAARNEIGQDAMHQRPEAKRSDEPG